MHEALNIGRRKPEPDVPDLCPYSGFIRVIRAIRGSRNLFVDLTADYAD